MEASKSRFKNSFCDKVIRQVGCQIVISTTIIVGICLIMFLSINKWMNIFEMNILFPYTDFLERCSTFSVSIGIMSFILIALLTISGILFYYFNKTKCAKIFWIFSLISSNLVFFCVGGFLTYLIFSPKINSVFDIDYCPSSNSLILVEMYNKIASTSPLNPCPEYCYPQKDHATKLYDCSEFRQSLGLMDYQKSDFDLLEQLENKYLCAGICQSHSKITCTYFNNMGMQTYKNCQVELKALAFKGYYIYCFLFFVFLIGIGKHISCLIDLIWNNNNNEGLELYVEKSKDQGSLFSGGGGEIRLNSDIKDNQIKDDNTKSVMNFKNLNFQGSSLISSINQNQNLDGFSNINNVLVFDKSKGNEKELKIKKELEPNFAFAIEEKKI